MPRPRGGSNKWNKFGRGNAPRGRKPYRGGRRSKSMGKRFTQRPAKGRLAYPVTQRKIHHEAWLWPLLQNPNAAPGVLMLTPIIVKTPDTVSRMFTRGHDISQVNSMAVMSRNISANLSVIAPRTSAVAEPIRLRIVQGYTKMPVRGDLKSSVGTSGAFDGVVTEFDPEVAYEDLAYEVFRDAIGNTLGLPDPSGNIQRETVHIVSDRITNMTAETVTGGTVYFKPLQANYNWKGGRMRLYPYVKNDDASSYDGSAVTPVNNPNLWTPFIAISVINFSSFKVAADQPTISLTWSHYWNNC